MKTLSRPHTLLVALLCLWLPMQAAAGLWLPCHWLDSATEPQAQQDEHRVHQGCGGAEENAKNLASEADNQNACYHCQVSCHSNSAILLPQNLPALTILPTHYTSLPTPSLHSVLLDNPHRPPRFA